MKHKGNKKMFKKSLLALALAGATISAANAAVIETKASTVTTNAPVAISNQGLPLTGEYNLKAADVLRVTFTAAEAAALIDQNFLAVTITGAFFADYEVGGATSLDTDDAYTPITGAVAHNGISLNAIPLSSSRASSATKLYMAFDGSGTATLPKLLNGVLNNAISTVLEFNDLNLQVISGATSITMTATVESESGVTIPGITATTTTIATMQDQWSLAITGLAAKIDVANDRETFVVKTGTTATTDTMVLNYTKNGSGATVASYKVTISGDFTGVESVGPGYTINTAMDEATKTIAADITSSSDETLTFTLESGADAVSQTERDFTADVEVTYDTSKNYDLATAKAAGGWTLNSSSMTMNYVPMGPNTLVNVNATSVFDEDASVDVSYLAADGSMELLTDIATVAPGVVTKLGNAISAAVLADMGTTSAKTKITVSVNAPEGNVTFFTGFSNISDGSRMGLEQTTTTEADAAAIKADLAQATDGLGALKTSITANGSAEKLASAKLALTDVITAVTAGTDFDGAANLLGTTTTFAIGNLICANANVGTSVYVLKDTAGVDALVDHNITADGVVDCGIAD